MKRTGQLIKKYYPIFFLETPITTLIYVGLAVGVAWFPKAVQPHSLFHIWTLKPDFSNQAFLVIGGFFAFSLLRAYMACKKGVANTKKIERLSLGQMALAGPREDPFYNWLLMYIIASILNGVNSLAHDRIRTVIEPIIVGDRWPLPHIAHSNAWAIIVAILIVSGIFAYHHVEWASKTETSREKWSHFITIFVTGYYLAFLNYFMGIFLAMLIHSLFDIALKLMVTAMLRRQLS